MADVEDDTVGPPPPPEDAEQDQGEQDTDVGPSMPKPKKRKVTLVPAIFDFVCFRARRAP